MSAAPAEESAPWSAELARAELTAQGRAFLARPGAGAVCAAAELLAWFGEPGRYAARWPLRGILEQDDPLALRDAVAAGFPVDAPVGFHRGSPLCEAALMGAERCAGALLDLGADIERSTDSMELPIEIALAEAAVDSRRLGLLSLLRARGARVDLAGRQASRQRSFGELFGLDGDFRRARPIGWAALKELSNQWDGIEKLEPSRHAAAVVAARRLDAARLALGMTHWEFLPARGAELAAALNQRELPEALGACLEALRERDELRDGAGLGLDSGSESRSRRL